MYAKILPALEMESVDQGKPNCVVLDEIDGAVGAEGQSAVDCIVSIATFKSKENKNAEERDDENEQTAENGANEGTVVSKKQAKKKKKNKNKKAGVDGPSRAQSRPIICICNELYAPAIARLREIAYVIKVDKPDMQRLLQRLRSICESEGFIAETKALTALAELTERDIRATLNALQVRGRRLKE